MLSYIQQKLQFFLKRICYSHRTALCRFLQFVSIQLTQLLRNVASLLPVKQSKFKTYWQIAHCRQKPIRRNEKNSFISVSVAAGTQHEPKNQNFKRSMQFFKGFDLIAEIQSYWAKVTQSSCAKLCFLSKRLTLRGSHRRKMPWLILFFSFKETLYGITR